MNDLIKQLQAITCATTLFLRKREIIAALESKDAEIERLTADRDEWERLWKKASNAVLSLQARVEALEKVQDAASDFLVNHMDDDYAMLLDEALAATEQEGE